MGWILKDHSPSLANTLNKDLTTIANFHDLGKAIPEFQRYIANPPAYRGNPNSKSHAPWSMLLWCAFAVKNDVTAERFLALSPAIWKHHGDFPNFEGIDGVVYFIDTCGLDKSIYPYEILKTWSMDINEDDCESVELDDLLESFGFNEKFYPLSSAVRLRMRAQFLFSVLIETDRFFLALDETARGAYLAKSKPVNIPAGLVDEFIQRKTLSGKRNEILNAKRTKVRKSVVEKSTRGVSRVSLPTGMGKTLIAAEWALKKRLHRDDNGEFRQKKVIVVLPYLSIIDQTAREYRRLLADCGEDVILEAHSLAERNYCAEDAEEERRDALDNAIDFFAEGWRAPLVITTFDQFIYALFSSKNRHLRRFHVLADALIVMDEIQSLPTALWEPLKNAIKVLTQDYGSEMMVMSATMPRFIESSELVNEVESVFAERNRYVITLNHRNPMRISEFVDNCQERIKREWRDKKVLIVLNTRKSAKEVHRGVDTPPGMAKHLISADVVPKERIESINRIKSEGPCFVVATQCVEAGVDIDMDFVVRDFAPLDSIIQVAGRCNRNDLASEPRPVELISLRSETGYFYSSIYDAILSQETATVLNEIDGDAIFEKDILPIVKQYFDSLNGKKDLGREHLRKWAYWREELNLRKILRGDQNKYEFLVLKMDRPANGDIALRAALENALAIEDVWKRKRALRKLNRRMAEITVSVWAREGLDPSDFSETLGPWRLLKDEFYESGEGIVLPERTESSFMI